MKRPLLTLTLALLAAPSLMGTRGESVSVGMPLWIADYDSIQLHGTGAPINWAAFTDSSFGTAGRRIVPSGYPVMLASGKIVPADGSSETLLLMSRAIEGGPSDSVSGYGLVTGGNVYESRLPTATGTNPRQLPNAVRTAVSVRIRLQQ